MNPLESAIPVSRESLREERDKISDDRRTALIEAQKRPIAEVTGGPSEVVAKASKGPQKKKKVKALTTPESELQTFLAAEAASLLLEQQETARRDSERALEEEEDDEEGGDDPHREFYDNEDEFLVGEDDLSKVVAERLAQYPGGNPFPTTAELIAAGMQSSDSSPLKTRVTSENAAIFADSVDSFKSSRHMEAALHDVQLMEGKEFKTGGVFVVLSRDLADPYGLKCYQVTADRGTNKMRTRRALLVMESDPLNAVSRLNRIQLSQQSQLFFEPDDILLAVGSTTLEILYRLPNLMCWAAPQDWIEQEAVNSQTSLLGAGSPFNSLNQQSKGAPFSSSASHVGTPVIRAAVAAHVYSNGSGSTFVPENVFSMVTANAGVGSVPPKFKFAH